MARFLLCLIFVALPLTSGQQACGLPPDQVAYSRIPPLKAPRAPSVSPHKSAERSKSTKAEDKAPRTTPPPKPPSASQEESNSTSDREKRLEIWNSSEMIAARKGVLEFCRLSARTTEVEGKQFLSRVSQLPSEDMQDWLQRYEARQSKLSRAQELEDQAREMAVERSLSKLEAQRHAAENAEYHLSVAAELANAQQERQEMAAVRLEQDRELFWALTRRNFNPFDVVFDPSSPRGYARKVAAAMSLPGDLPRSDSRNFIRGERGETFIDPSDAPAGEPNDRQ
ncbi:hypothetical protein [Adhaeretor mobilis]|uniref:Uncharacterized protein n=1 Tax=Adhaeretor mobilis TaxID=1930276 RepID=A0A517MQU5_9BACT|nr:hypothetical protein [Adhaeretor mobilis]QDS97256.1 hypothetical protein HG15A2_05170 [Adhaeretor mobilis]